MLRDSFIGENAKTCMVRLPNVVRNFLQKTILTKQKSHLSIKMFEKSPNSKLLIDLRDVSYHTKRCFKVQIIFGVQKQAKKLIHENIMCKIIVVC